MERWEGLSGWCVGGQYAQHDKCPTPFQNGDCTCPCHEKVDNELSSD